MFSPDSTVPGRRALHTAVLAACLALPWPLAGNAQEDATAALQRAEVAYSHGDYGDAVAIWSRLADAGNRRAQFALGNAYERGHGVAPDYRSAAQWYRRAARAGLAEAQYNLGNLYLNGQGVPEDPVEAVALFRRAAAQGFLAAQFNLAYAYDSGTGVDADRSLAAAWYGRAAIGGSLDAMQRLSELRREGVRPAALPSLELPGDDTPPGPAATAAADDGFAVTTVADRWYLRLAAYRSEAGARRGWEVLRGRHGEVLGDLEPAMETVDLGPERGRFLRLLAGPLGSEQAARRACRHITDARGDCLVQRGGP